MGPAKLQEEVQKVLLAAGIGEQAEHENEDVGRMLMADPNDWRGVVEALQHVRANAEAIG